MAMLQPSRVLALGGHTDDIELGCGATLSRFRRQGAEVAVAAFSRAELSRPKGTPEDILEQEFRSAMTQLGVNDDQVHCFRYPVRTMAAHRQEILDALIRLRREVDPDLVITMSQHDTHQDHEVISAESVRAFRSRGLIAYQSPWNQRQTATPLFIEVTPDDFRMKMQMLQEYRTQTELGRPYMRQEYVEASLRFYGQQAGLDMAEAFEILSLTVRE